MGQLPVFYKAKKHYDHDEDTKVNLKVIEWFFSCSPVTISPNQEEKDMVSIRTVFKHD